MQQAARLRIESDRELRHAVVGSVLLGPLDVQRIAAEASDLPSKLALPLRALLPAEGERRLAAQCPLDPRHGDSR